MSKALRRQNLFVKNIPPEVVTDKQLEQFFSKFGKVKNAKVYVTETDEQDEVTNILEKETKRFVGLG